MRDDIDCDEFSQRVQRLIYQCCHFKLTARQVHLAICGLAFDYSGDIVVGKMSFDDVNNYILDLVS